MKVAYLSELEPTNRAVLAGTGKGTPMLKVVENEAGEERTREDSALDRLAREGAQRMLAEALEAEVDAYTQRHRKARDQRGHALVVRHGRAQTGRGEVGGGGLPPEGARGAQARVVR